MISSDIDICNLALNWCSVRNITSFEENTKQSKVCAAWYDLVRKSLLTNLNASFSIARSRLVEKADCVPIYGFTKAFALPFDCLQVLSLGSPIDDRLYQIEKDGFYCDESIKEVNIRYIADIKDVVKFDADFAELFTLELAYRINISLSEDAEKTNWIKGLAQQKYIDCSVKYGRDNRIVVVNQPRWRNAKINAQIPSATYPLR